MQTSLMRSPSKLTHDCRIFTCLYTRCLATRCSMIRQTSIPAYRQLMIQELHQKKLSPIPPPPIQPGEYYSVDHVKNYYFGRVLDSVDSFVQFKFLHRVGATNYHWPRRDNVDKCTNQMSFLVLLLFQVSLVGHFKFQSSKL